jgi:hypothetical protein
VISDDFGNLLFSRTKSTAEILAEMRATAEAKQMFRSANASEMVMPEIATLAERATRPRDTIRYRVDGWQKIGAFNLLAAQAKAGKTTTTGNLVRSLVDGDRFLSVAPVTPLDGRVVIIDNEMDERQAEDWLLQQGIVNMDQVALVALRGRVSTFDVTDTTIRAKWAQHLRSVDAQYVIFDCLRPSMDALGLNEHTDAGRFLTPFGELMGAAGVTEGLVVHHMGHEGARARGDSRILDWPDAVWNLFRSSADAGAERTLSAAGRDVDIPEGRITFDPETRHLTYHEKEPKSVREARKAQPYVEAFLQEHGESSGNAIDKMPLPDGVTRQAIRDALDIGKLEGVFDSRKGERRAVLWSLTPPVSTLPIRQRSEGTGAKS